MITRLAGWFAVILCILLGIAVIVFYNIGLIAHATIVVRALIIVPFVLWWGVRQIKKTNKPDIHLEY